jgi:23S rRNA pseudouridine1911/1915/1917 synthase
MTEPEIIYQDKDLLVVNKPAGLVVHEGAGQTGATLVDWLKQTLPRSPLTHERYGILHRLDKDTSGLLLVAKTQVAFDYYKKLFKLHKIKKEYLALVHGRLTPDRGLIQIPLARHLIKRTRFEAAASGRMAETEYAVTKYYASFSYLKAWPKTGRTHQLRVHFASIGHPIVGDKIYGKKDALARQFLHAHQLNLVGLDGTEHQFVAPLAPDLTKFLHGLK